MSRECTSHHYACDCREAMFAQIRADNEKLRVQIEGMRNMGGLIAQELMMLRNGRNATYDMCASWAAEIAAGCQEDIK